MQKIVYVTAIACLLMSGLSLSAQDFFIEDFDGGIPDTWTNEVVQGNGEPSAAWVHTTAGPQGPVPTAPLASTTADNGWVLFDSDLNCNSGGSQDAWLISPAIDASARASVWLTFETYYASFNDRPQIRVGTDLNNLNSWQSIEVFPGIEANDFGGPDPGGNINPVDMRFDLSEFAAGQSNFYFAFQFLADASTTNNGDPTVIACAYSWQIDDVVLTETDPRPANEMGIDPFFAIAPNAITPGSQVEPIAFLADISNNGSAVQSSSTLHLSIRDQDNMIVYQDSVEYDEIAPDSTAENVIFPSEFTPPPSPNVYTGTYMLSYSGLEEDVLPENNTRSFVFAVSDTLFTKELGATTNIFAADSPNYSYGNVFYVENANDQYIRYVTFGVANADELVDRSVNILVYKWDGEQASPRFIEQDESDVVGVANYTFDGTENNVLLHVPINDIIEGFVTLEDNTYYIPVISYLTNNEQDMALLASEGNDYFATVFLTDSLNRPRFASALNVNGSDDGALDILGFGYDIVPLVRMSIGDDPPNDIVGIGDPIGLPSNAVNVFPTPASDVVQVSFDLIAEAQGQITVVDVSGQQVLQRAYKQLFQNTVQIPVSDWPAGSYWMQVQTSEGNAVRRIVVQH